MTNDLTMRERVALRILAVMFQIVSPNRKYEHKNKEMISSIFADNWEGDKDD